MNTRKPRGRPKKKDDTPVQENPLTPKNATKNAMFTPCRRLGLGRKRAATPKAVPEIETKTPTTSTQEKLEVPSTSQPALPTPVEEKPKSSASRRKKSSHPLKRTLNDSDNSEGNTYTVIVSPVLKRQKLEISQPNVSINKISSDNLQQNAKSVAKSCEESVKELPKLPESNKTSLPVKNKTTMSLKVSLPLTISQKYLNSAFKSINKKSSDTSVCESATTENKNEKSNCATNLVEIPVNTNLKSCEPSENSAKIVTKPIKKRKIREKINDISENKLENVENEAKSDINMEECSKRTKKTPKGRQKRAKKGKPKARTPKIKLNKTPLKQKLVNKARTPIKIIDNIDNNIDDGIDDDFMEVTPRTKKKIKIKNKTIIEPKNNIKNSKKEKVVEPNLQKNKRKRTKNSSIANISMELEKKDDTKLLSNNICVNIKETNKNDKKVIDNDTKIDIAIDRKQEDNSNTNMKVSNESLKKIKQNDNDSETNLTPIIEQDNLPVVGQEEVGPENIVAVSAEKTTQDSDFQRNTTTVPAVIKEKRKIKEKVGESELIPENIGVETSKKITQEENNAKSTITEIITENIAEKSRLVPVVTKLKTRIKEKKNRTIAKIIGIEASNKKTQAENNEGSKITEEVEKITEVIDILSAENIKQDSNFQRDRTPIPTKEIEVIAEIIGVKTSKKGIQEENNVVPAITEEVEIIPENIEPSRNVLPEENNLEINAAPIVVEEVEILTENIDLAPSQNSSQINRAPIVVQEVQVLIENIDLGPFRKVLPEENTSQINTEPVVVQEVEVIDLEPTENVVHESQTNLAPVTEVIEIANIETPEKATQNDNIQTISPIVVQEVEIVTENIGVESPEKIIYNDSNAEKNSLSSPEKQIEIESEEATKNKNKGETDSTLIEKVADVVDEEIHKKKNENSFRSNSTNVVLKQAEETTENKDNSVRKSSNMEVDCPPLSKSGEQNCLPKSSLHILQLQTVETNTKSKMEDDQLSFNEDSYESSHYSTPAYSPIEEAARLPEDKEFIIQRCDVIKLSPTKRNDVIHEVKIVDKPNAVNNVSNVKISDEFRSSFVNKNVDKNLNKTETFKGSEKVIEKTEVLGDIPADQRGVSKTKNKEKKLLTNILVKEQNDYNTFETILKEKTVVASERAKNIDRTAIFVDKNENIPQKQKKCSITDEINSSLLETLELKKKAKKTTEKAPKKTELINFYPRVLLNSDDIENYFKELEIMRQKADEKIYRVNKPTPTRRRLSMRSKKTVARNTRKSPRKHSEAQYTSHEIDLESHIQEKNFIITRVQGCVDEKEIESKVYKETSEFKNKNSRKFGTSREESVFFTPPSSRSENDSDSNRNDFQVESELSPNTNPFGEGPSTQYMSPTSLKTLSNSSALLSTYNEEVTQEDKEVEGFSSKNVTKRKGKQKRKSPRTTTAATSRNSNISELISEGFGFTSDSDDDFRSPKSPPKQIPSKSYVIKNEGGVKSILKKNESSGRIQNFRLTNSSSVTVVNRGQCIAYVKAYDRTGKKRNDYQTQQVSDKSMIVEHHYYNSNEDISSIFDSVIDDPEAYKESQKTPPPRSLTNPTKREVVQEIKELEMRIKEKQAKLERLNLISVYKKKHNLDNIKEATLQIKKGAQDALLELAAVLRQRSKTPFDMGTLLHNMHIPHEVVGYNMEQDEFT